MPIDPSNREAQGHVQLAAFHEVLEIFPERAARGKLIRSTTAKYPSQLARAHRPSDLQVPVRFCEPREVEQRIRG